MYQSRRVHRIRVLHTLVTVALALAGLAGVSGFGFAQSRAPSFVARFTRDVLPTHLDDADNAFQSGDQGIRRSVCAGAESRDRHYVKTATSDYLSRDWTYEVTFNAPANAPDDIIFIGFGSGQPDPTFFNEPRSAVNFRIHQGQSGFGVNWRVDVVSHDVGAFVFPFFQTTGHLNPPGAAGGILTARIRKSGTAVTFEILDPALTLTIPDIGTAAPFLGPSSDVRLFFGNACGDYAYSEVRVLPGAANR